MAQRWLKGNTHTHTSYSDGDSPPEVVVDWYAEHGYDFLFLTDHNVVIPSGHLSELQRRGPRVWAGEEITMSLVHVNGLGLRETIPLPQEPIPLDWSGYPAKPSTLLRWAAARTAAQGGIASVNHPNLYRGLRAEDIRRAGNVRLLEIANMNPDASRSNGGDAERPSTEETWDALLAAGLSIWAVASDDAHHFQSWGADRANPGRGWIMVEAQPELESCLAALDEGRFYCSTGLELADYRVSNQEVAIELAGPPELIELIGPGGSVVSAQDTQSAHFPLRSDWPYVRLRATTDSGARLWTQPFHRSLSQASPRVGHGVGAARRAGSVPV